MGQYDLTLPDYWRIIRKRPWLVLGSLLLRVVVAH